MGTPSSSVDSGEQAHSVSREQCNVISVSGEETGIVILELAVHCSLQQGAGSPGENSLMGNHAGDTLGHLAQPGGVGESALGPCPPALNVAL